MDPLLAANFIAAVTFVYFCVLFFMYYNAYEPTSSTACKLRFAFESKFVSYVEYFLKLFGVDYNLNLSYILLSLALRCWECENVYSQEECLQQGKSVECDPATQVMDIEKVSQYFAE